MPKAVHVGQTRQVAQRHRLVGQERARHQGERAVLGAGNGETALQGLAALDDDAIHAQALKAKTAERKAGLGAHEPDGALLRCCLVESNRRLEWRHPFQPTFRD
jgi:hypothetical protein